MKKNILFIITALLLVLPLAAFAQDDEDQPALLSFKGGVGLLYTGGEPYDNGAVFEIAGYYRAFGPVHLQVYGGISNFDSNSQEILPLSDEFTSFWNQVLTDTDVLEVEKLRYKVNFVGGGIMIPLETGNFEPHVSAGVGGYQIKFISEMNIAPLAIPEDQRANFAEFVSFEDDKWFLGYYVGGGVYYKINEIIGFGGDFKYHFIDTEEGVDFDDMASFTFGMYITVP